MKKKTLTSRKITFSAVSIALATVTANFIKTPSLPFGGSMTLFSMLFAAVPGFLFGPLTGLIAAFAHGLIQFISNPYVVHPIQVLLDYFLAFTALGLSGFTENKKNGLIKGYTLGVLGRFVFVCLSGFVFYTSYIGAFKADFIAIIYSIGYNLSYILPEYVLTLVVLMLPPVKKAFIYIKKIANE